MAPVFMRLGWTRPAEAIYAAYATQCHQLSQRSYFLFGPRLMYAADELGIGAGPSDFMALRAFTGTAALGWKVAWSDRMTAMYSGLFLFLIAVRLVGRRLRPLGVVAFLLLLLPMAIDGGTHFISDLSGFGQGFRDTNLWLVGLTGGRLAPTFYAGDAWGSFNASMRLLTGVLFGLGVAWFAAPRIEATFQAAQAARDATGRRAAARQALREDIKPVYNSSTVGSPIASERGYHSGGAAPRDGGK
jgi:uncharacterized membrane protein